jgi:hypothetical protein
MAIDPAFASIIPAANFARCAKPLMFTAEISGGISAEQRIYRDMFEIRVSSEELREGCKKPSEGYVHMVDGHIPLRTVNELFERRSWATFNSLEHGMVDHEVRRCEQQKRGPVSSSMVVEVTADGTELYLLQSARTISLPGAEKLATLVYCGIGKTRSDLDEMISLVDSIEATAWVD